MKIKYSYEELTIICSQVRTEATYEIRALYQAGQPMTEIAARSGASSITVAAIVKDFQTVHSAEMALKILINLEKNKNMKIEKEKEPLIDLIHPELYRKFSRKEEPNESKRIAEEKEIPLA